MTDAEVITVCKNHPNRETLLRCSRCSDPICASCAIKTPTGYQCSECTRRQQKTFDTAEPIDYLAGSAVALVIYLIASYLIQFVGGFGFFGWIIVFAGSPAIGNVAAEAVRKAIRRHRSRELFITIAVSAVIGALPAILGMIFFFDLFGLVFQGIFLFLSIPAMFVRLSGIQLFR